MTIEGYCPYSGILPFLVIFISIYQQDYTRLLISSGTQASTSSQIFRRVFDKIGSRNQFVPMWGNLMTVTMTRRGQTDEKVGKGKAEEVGGKE